jgi:hypothetical protein
MGAGIAAFWVAAGENRAGLSFFDVDRSKIWQSRGSDGERRIAAAQNIAKPQRCDINPFVDQGWDNVWITRR